MNPEDAEEYTKGLGQIVAGVRRQMEEGARLGVPEALGLSTSEWMDARLGGAPGTSTPEPPEAVAEVAARNGAPAEGEHRRKPLSRRIYRAVKKESPATSSKPVVHGNVAQMKLRRPRRHWLVIPVCGVLGLFAGLILGASAPPSYESQAAAIVSMTSLPADDPNSSDPFGGSQFALQRVQSYAELATSPQVLQGALRDLHRGDGGELSRNVKVSSTGGVMLWVTVDDGDPKTAAHMADAVMANLVRSVAALEAGGGQHSPIQLVPVQPAIVPEVPVASGAFLDTLFGLLVGLGLGGAAYYFIRRRSGGKRHQNAARRAESALYQRAEKDHDDKSGVVVLRVGDGRNFSRRVGR
jgi:capsular polysaccharide biosynthesis protein